MEPEAVESCHCVGSRVGPSHACTVFRGHGQKTKIRFRQSSANRRGAAALHLFGEQECHVGRFTRRGGRVSVRFGPACFLERRPPPLGGGSRFGCAKVTEAAPL